LFNKNILSTSIEALCKLTTASGIIFLCIIANAELVLKFHIALHASHAALPILTSKFHPKVDPCNGDKNFTKCRSPKFVV
jgi:hypothetical protein